VVILNSCRLGKKAFIRFEKVGGPPKYFPMKTPLPFVLTAVFFSILFALNSQGQPKTLEAGFTPLFPKEGIPEGWSVRDWADVKNPGPAGAAWRVTNGVLHGSEPRGTWLVSEKLYSDFVLKFEWKLGMQGNSGCGLRFPDYGDPAFDGLEVQMVDPRYYPPEQKVTPSELTSSLYLAVAGKPDRYKASEWNNYEITCKGPNVTVVLNGEEVLKVNIKEVNKTPKRHNGKDAVPMNERPLKGHIGFQELSRGGGHVEIRNVRIKELTKEKADNGAILLHSRDATTHGSTIRYEPQPNKNTIGYWLKQEDWVSWNFQVPAPGKYTVEVLQGCGPKSGGSVVEFTSAEQTLAMTVQETTGFQDFLRREIGTFEFKVPGEYTLAVKPKTKPGFAVMDLRQVRLIPL